MKIKSQIDIVNWREYGYIDVGTGVEKDEVPKAENVLVLMLVAENDKWKIPTSFYFINSLTGGEKAEILKTNLMAIHNTGIIVTSITFDGLLSTYQCAKS